MAYLPVTAGGDLSGTYPNPQIVAGSIVDADINANAGIQISKLAAAFPGYTAAAYLTAATTSIPNTTQTTLSGWTARANNDSSFLARSTGLYLPYSGWFLIQTQVSFAFNASGYRMMQSTFVGYYIYTYSYPAPTSADTTVLNMSYFVNYDLGWDLSIDVSQTSGAALNVNGGTGGGTELRATWLGNT